MGCKVLSYGAARADLWGTKCSYGAAVLSYGVNSAELWGAQC